MPFFRYKCTTKNIFFLIPAPTQLTGKSADFKICFSRRAKVFWRRRKISWLLHLLATVLIICRYICWRHFSLLLHLPATQLLLFVATLAGDTCYNLLLNLLATLVIICCYILATVVVICCYICCRNLL